MIRRTARWQTTLDERILERLRDAGETTVPLLSAHLEVPRGMIRDRVQLLAQVELVEVEATGDRDWYDLSYWGQLYLEGEYDVGLHPHPRLQAGHLMRV